MEKQEITLQDLELLAAAMAKAIPDLDCPECCECGVVFHYVERSSQLYRDEWEWSCFHGMLMEYRHTKTSLR